MKDRQNVSSKRKEGGKNSCGADTATRGSVKIFVSDDTGGMTMSVPVSVSIPLPVPV